jgi:hypothetical protein
MGSKASNPLPTLIDTTNLSNDEINILKNTLQSLPMQHPNYPEVTFTPQWFIKALREASIGTIHGAELWKSDFYNISPTPEWLYIIIKMNEINNHNKLSISDRINRVFQLASQEKDLLWTIQRVIKKYPTNPEYALTVAMAALEQANACKFNITTWEAFLKEYPD